MNSTTFRSGPSPARQSARRSSESRRFGSVKLSLDHSRNFFDGIEVISNRKVINQKNLVVNAGKSMISFNKKEVAELAAPFAYTIIGNFSNHVPNIASIAPTIKGLALKGNFFVSFMDSQRLCIRLLCEEDFILLKSKGFMFIAGCYLSLLEWTPFKVFGVDSPLVPVWLTLKNVPFMFFQSEALFEIAKLLGKPLRVDDATAILSRLDRVRVCVELDVSKPLLDSVFLLYHGLECEIKVFYDDVPVYCVNCCKLGHVKDSCVQGPKGIFGEAPISSDPPCSQVSDLSSLYVHSGVLSSSGNGCTEYSDQGSENVVDSAHFSDELFVFPFTFDSYFDPEMQDFGKSVAEGTNHCLVSPQQTELCVSKDSGEALLMAVGEDSSKNYELENFVLYPYPLLVDVNNGAPEFEACFLSHRRRKSIGDFRSLGKSLSMDSFEDFGSRYVGHQEDLLVSDHEAYNSPDYDDWNNPDFTSFEYDYD